MMICLISYNSPRKILRRWESLLRMNRRSVRPCPESPLPPLWRALWNFQFRRLNLFHDKKLHTLLQLKMITTYKSPSPAGLPLPFP
ncbi:hypothetical protein GUJ93_ZPchr0011g27879 [Zizania palustris]|uniref:Uncharacterized protein n=1 Tax=Zizania palustris TaxID=103762 RepID=A0A8J5WHZ2_ZIZPA|nr:hypothetical protein GUJ93_ZPchr0011g27879 [Zizania palustris]